MSSRSSFLLLSPTLLPGIPPRCSLFFKGAWSFGAKDKRVNFDSGLGCRATSKPRSRDVFQNGLPVLKWPEIVEDDIEGPEALKVSTTNYEIKERVNSIKMILRSMEDGEISISAYDTAWVSLVQDVRGSGLPQFPSSLQWIAKNQLPDGSWGDSDIFLSYDRIINTLACVVALKSWTMHPEKCEKGIRFLRETISKLEGENAEHMPIGFEVAFPSLLEIARSLNIEVVPDDSPVLQDIYAKRNIKLTRIPRDIMHRVPTTLLHSLEGMPGLHWEKLLKLQSKDGSFLFSPSSTAFALMQTKDDNCLKYLKNAVLKFNGGVPNVYPVDLFEHIWVVDRLQRLGISRYFQPEIKGCVNYVYRYWTDKGICWARNSEVSDIDDTAMGFRILRLHGHEISADVFQHFEKGGEFFCFAGQSTQAVTGMFNLYRASQVLFPGEKILEDAKQFSSNFLREKQVSNELFDKWIIMKDLPSEVGYALEVPWYASLPRVETRFYVEQYGAEDDVWIGKTLYRMPYVNNNTYLELAKQDYNNCQASHLMEWDSIQKWYSERNLEDFGLSRRTLLFAYFLAAASIFESGRSNERLAWVKTAALIEAITSHFQEKESRRAFLLEFRNHSSNRRNYINGRTSNANQTVQELVRTLLETLNHLSLEATISNGQDISHHLRQAWEKWMLKWQSEGDRHQGEAELLAHIINLTACRSVPKELLFHPQYKRLSDLLNRVYYKLCSHQRHKVHDNGNHTSHANSIRNSEIDSGMQELVKLVLQNSSDDIDSDIKQTFLALAKSFYYAAYCDHGTINLHIAKVLFERVV